MFKRTIVAVITFAALLCSGLTVNAVRYGDGDHGEDFHSSGWTVPDSRKPGKPESPHQPEYETVDEPTVEKPEPPHEDELVKLETGDNQSGSDNWLIYWYVCGTDLESDSGYMSKDIEEMRAVKLPPNVKVLIQAGTTSKWHHSIVNANGRYIYDSNGLRPDGAPFESNMYESNTLKKFLEYGKQKYPAGHKIFIFQDHGGVSGVCQDKENTGETLSLNGIIDAFKSVYTQSPENPSFEIIAFDTCEMASFECANSIYGFARYMVASENNESATGFYYTSWINELAKNPKISGGDLGKIICTDSLQNDSDKDNATFSVIDMSRFGNLRTAHENFFTAALKNNITAFDRIARSSDTEKYGFTQDYDGDFVDLMSLARNSQNLLPTESKALMVAIDGTNGKSGAVIHTSNGRYRIGGGISTFYPYDPNSFDYFNEDNAAPYNQKLLYAQMLSLTTADAQTNVQNTSAPVRIGKKGSSRFNVAALQGMSLTLDGKHALAKLTPEQLESVSSVRGLILLGSDFSSSEFGIKDEGAVILGSNIAVKTDWNSGTFRDDFRPQWLALDGHPLSLEMTFQGNGYKLFETPIKLNDQLCVLQISYTDADKKYHIDGAHKYSENGMASRGGLSLNAGDKITPLFLAFAPADSLDADEDMIVNKFCDAKGNLILVLKVTEGKAFTISQNPTLEEKSLDYTDFAFCFEFFAPDRTAAISQFVAFTVEDGKVIEAELVPVEKADVTVK